jgi:hypothetical protein
MTDPTPVSRRKLLAALGAVGVASAGAGLGTTAFFRDSGSIAAGLRTGGLDLQLDYRSTYDGPGGVTLLGQRPADRVAWRETKGLDRACTRPDLVDGDRVPVIDLDGVQPGDAGTTALCLHTCDNPSRLWARACVTDAENGIADAEATVDRGSPGELADATRVVVWLDPDDSGTRGPDEPVVYRGTLAGLGAVACDGVPLVGTRGDAAGTRLGKLEDLDGSTFLTVEDGAGTTRATTADERDTDTYELVDATGRTVAVTLSAFEFEDGEVVGVRLRLADPGLGVYRASVTAGGETREQTFGTCPRSVLLRAPRSGRLNRLRREISSLDLVVREPPSHDCVAPGVHCVGVEWSLPRSIGDEVQTDTASLALAFAAVQCRHAGPGVSPFG